MATTTTTTQPVSGLAITSLILGILTLLMFWVPFLHLFPGLLAIIFGIVGLRMARRGTASGGGLAVAGILCAVLGMIPTFMFGLALVGIGLADPEVVLQQAGEFGVEQIEQVGGENFGVELGEAMEDLGTSAGFGGFTRRPEPPLEAVSIAQYDASWSTDLNAQDRPARELLEQLAAELGFTMKTDGTIDAALAQPATLQREGISRLEAIEHVCRQVDIYPRYSERTYFGQGRPSEKTMSFVPGPRPFPATFVGPFLVEMMRLDHDTQHATGKLKLDVYAVGLPPVVFKRLKDRFGRTIAIDRVEDAAGQNLQHRVSQQGPAADSFHAQVFIGLKNLLRHVDRIKLLEGSIKIPLPTQVETVRFDELSEGSQKAVGDAELTLEQVRSHHVSIEYRGTQHDQLELVAYDEANQTIKSSGGGYSGSDDEGRLDRQFDKEPAALEVRVVTATEDIAYQFAMHDVPLEDHALALEKLEPLVFDSDKPVSLEFVRFTGDPNFRKIIFRATNHANKDAERLSMSIRYLGAAKNLLKESPNTHTEEMPMGEATEIEVAAFFMPEQTKSVDATVQEVEFADAMQWDHEQTRNEDGQRPVREVTKTQSVNSRDENSYAGAPPDVVGKKASKPFTADKVKLAIPPLRTWTDHSGTRTIEARLLKFKGRKVTLKRKDGKVFTFDKTKLSVADQEHLKNLDAPGE